MAAVGPHAHLEWTLSGASLVLDQSSERVPGLERLAEESHRAGGARLTWSDMEFIAVTCLQVIDGTFTGTLRGELVLELSAVDSSFWLLWASDDAVTQRVSSAFDGVVVSKHARPPSLRA
jgi:hypothetical protein